MRSLRTTVPMSIAAAVLAVLTLAACGKREETGTKTTAGGAPAATTNVSVMLDYLPNVDHAGLYAAVADGEFAQAGLKVTPQVPGDAASPLKVLLAGKVDMAISYEPEVFLARDKGAQLVSVAAIAQRPLTSLMSIDDKVPAPKDLKGTTVGTAGIPYQSAYLKTILAGADVSPSSVKEINVGFNLVQSMLTKKVDATLGAFWNVEGVQLQRAKKKPAIIPVDEAGVPTYDELVLVVRKQYARDHGPTIRRFVQALKRGTDAVKADPAVGIDALLQADPSLDRPTLAAQLTATLDANPPVFYPDDAKEPFGWQQPTEWERFGSWMLDQGLLDAPAQPGIITNEFLPGEGI